MVRQTVYSWEHLQAQIEQILDQLHADPRLAQAAAINPLLALEEIGYDIDPQERPLIEERLRFGPSVAARLRVLRERIYAYAGRVVQLDYAEDLRTLLFDELKLSLPSRSQQQAYQATVVIPIDTRALPPQLSYRPKVEDSLEQLRSVHPIMEPLLEYRRLESSAPLLAPRHMYDAVRQGRRSLPFSRIQARLKSQPSAPSQPTPPSSITRVNINSASAAELTKVQGIGPRLAERIVDYRLAFGPFSTVAGLASVSGIGEGLLERLRPFITV